MRKRTRQNLDIISGVTEIIKRCYKIHNSIRNFKMAQDKERQEAFDQVLDNISETLKIVLEISTELNNKFKSDKENSTSIQKFDKKPKLRTIKKEDRRND